MFIPAIIEEYTVAECIGKWGLCWKDQEHHNHKGKTAAITQQALGLEAKSFLCVLAELASSFQANIPFH